MHQLLASDRGRGFRAFVLFSSLLVPLLFLAQISAAPAGNDSQVGSVGHFVPSREGSEGEKIPEQWKWNALTRCIRDSKEERAVERWLFCVEDVRSWELSGIPFYGQESQGIKQSNEVSSVYAEWSTTEVIDAQESRWRALMDLQRPNDELELTQSSESGRAQREQLQESKEGLQDGDLGLFPMEDLSCSKAKGSMDSIEKINIDSRTNEIFLSLEENGHRGFATGPADVLNSVAVSDNASDSESKSREEFLSFRADENVGSDSGDEVDQVLPGFKASGGKDDPQQHSEKDTISSNSLKTEALNSHHSGSQGGLLVEKEQVPSTSQQHRSSNFGMRDTCTFAAIAVVLTLMLRVKRGRGRGKPENQPEISSGGSKSAVESTVLQVEQQVPSDLQKLSEPLGMAVAQVLFEVLEQNGDYYEGSLSPESLSNLLETGLKESLIPALGSDRVHFVEKFRDSFCSTYRTRQGVRGAFLKAGLRQTPSRHAGAKSCRGPQPKSRREPQREQHSDEVERHSNDREDSSFNQGTTSFFSTSRYERDGQSDGAGSSTANHFGGSSLSPISQVPSGSQGENPSQLEEECSEDERMYSADDSSESEEWILLEGRGNHSEAVRQKKSTAQETSTYQSVERDQIADEKGLSIRDMSSSAQPDSSSAGGLGIFVDSQWEGGSLSSRGNVTPRLDLSDQTVDFLDLTGGTRLNDHTERSLSGLFADSLLDSKKPRVASLTTSEDSQGSSLRTPEHNLGLHSRRGRSECSLRKSVSGNLNNGRFRNRATIRPQPGLDRTQSLGRSPVQDALVLASSSNVVGYNAALEERYDLLERSVAAQEHHNRLMTWELQHKLNSLAIKEEHLYLHSESNSLMKENVDLSRSKAEFRENELQDRKLTLAYYEFNRTCADELVAGLCVMLVVLGFCFWKFSYDRLTTIVTVCQPVVRENHQGGWLGTNWMYNSLNLFTYQMQAFMCEVTKLSRMVFGIVVIAMVTSALLRRSVTSSSQAMPATIIVIVLGGICGFAGKISIDSLGGSGIHWLILWECLCGMHALATCFTSLLYHFLHGAPARNYFDKASLASRISSTLTLFAFHSVLVFFLPVMAGILPFASPEDIMQIFFDWWAPGTPRSQYRVIP